MIKKKKFKRNKTKFWTLWAMLFAVLFLVGYIGGGIANTYAAAINSALSISTTKVTGLDESESSSNYAFTAEAEEQLQADNLALVDQVVQEGAVLVKNNNYALPLEEGSSISIFGNAQYKYLDMASALETNGMTVNQELYEAYQSLSTTYKNVTGTAVNEVPFDEIASVVGSGDVALIVLGRDAGEGSDCVSTEDGDYLALSSGETQLLQQLTYLKENGVFQKLVVVLTTSNSIDSEFLQDGNVLGIDVDAVVWLAMPSNGSYTEESTQAFVDLLCGKDGLDFSGRLVDTMYVDNQLLPEMQNIVTDADTSNVDSDLIKEVMSAQSEWAGAQGNYWRTTITYAEGIYHSYRYYETRYEDYILNGNEHGAYSNWSYDAYVAAAFGTGLHYNTEVSYTGMSVEVNDASGTFEVTVTVTNDGDTDVKHSVLVYMQTPYSQRDQSLGIEESAIKLVGYEKVTIPANSSVDVVISVDQEEMATYDEYEALTYIRDEGTYYLTVGESVHDAMNNILAEKVAGNEAAAARMEELSENGDASLVWSQDYTFDDEIFSTSSITGYEITNQFETGDLNKDEDAQAAGNQVTYLSRLDWVGTFPTEVTVTYNDAMVYAATPQVYETDDEAVAETEMPLFDQDLGEDTVTLVDLIGLDYDDPLWTTFLSQLSVDEIVTNVSSKGNTQIADLLVPVTQDLDGPTSIGETTNNGVEPVDAVSEDLRAATFNKELLEEVGRQLFGENMIHSSGDTVIGWWGPGVNIHRTPYGGRNYSYYSEDGFVSGISAAYETKGVQSVGGVVVAKHFILNDQETNRHGVAVWANEQTIREIYLTSFKMAAELGGLDSVMTSFNRLGMQWTGQTESILQDVLRGELGMNGMIITDAYETDYQDVVDGIIAGNTRWLCFSTSVNVTDPIYELLDAGDTVFATKLVEAVHHNLWNVVNSFAMDGYTSDTVVTVLTPWWKTALNIWVGLSGVLTIGSIALAVRSYISKKKRMQQASAR